jgi:hypothetical protein
MNADRALVSAVADYQLVDRAKIRIELVAI